MTSARKPYSFRKYTISEIINAVIGSGFTLERFDEHPSWNDPRLPGEFTLAAKIGLTIIKHAPL